jgi:hypothetical protein
MHTRSKIKHVKNIQKIVKGHLVRRKIYPYKYITYYYNKYLKNKGCKLPSKVSVLGKALEYLYINIKKENNINDIRKYVGDSLKKDLNNSNDSLQVRHLGLQFGFNILKSMDNRTYKIKKSNYLLFNLTRIYENFYKDKRKQENINKENWYELKKEYEFKCATCGNEENKPMKYNKNRKTILQKGHMDPRKSLTIDNIIPQCSYCNQNYKNKAIFNKRGIIIDFNKKGF